MNKKLTLILCLLFCWGSLTAAPVDIVPAESVGFSSDRLQVLQSNLQ